MVFTLFFVDAVLTKGTSFDIDAIIIQNIHDEFKFSDVHLQDVLHLEEGPRLDFTADALTILRPEFDFDVDAFLKSIDNEFDFDVDANVQIMPSENFEADALLQEEFSTSFEADAILIERKTFDYELDSVLVRRLQLDFPVDGITLGSLDNEFEVDAQLIVLDRETDFEADGNIQLVPRTRPIVDAYILDTFDDDSLVDGRVILRPNNDFEVDGNLQKPGFQPFNVDAFVLDSFGLFTMVDAVLVLPTGDIDICTIHFCTPTQPVEFFTVDAILPTRIEHTFNLDAFLREDIVGHNFQVDALLSNRFEHEFTVDANIIKPSQFNACPSLMRETLNCVSVIRRRGV